MTDMGDGMRKKGIDKVARDTGGKKQPGEQSETRV